MFDFIIFRKHKDKELINFWTQNCYTFIKIIYSSAQILQVNHENIHLKFIFYVKKNLYASKNNKFK